MDRFTRIADYCSAQRVGPVVPIAVIQFFLSDEGESVHRCSCASKITAQIGCRLFDPANEIFIRQDRH